MLQCFVDDSICKTGDRRLFLAGYIQSAEEWIAFSEQWDAALNEHPKIGYFKMSEAHARRGEFKSFSVAQKTAKVFRLAEIIEKFDPSSYHTSISIRDFNRILKPFAPYPFESPYSLLFQGIVLGVARFHNDHQISEPTRLIFDRQDGLPSKVIPLFEAMFDTAPEEWRKLITGIPQFEDDVCILPLQAADMLAWHIRREYEGSYPSEYDGITSMITKEGISSYTTVTEVELQKFADAFSSMPKLAEIDKKIWRNLAPIIQAAGSRR